MRLNPSRLLAITFTALFLFAIQTQAAPSIASLSPPSGAVGESVTIAGSGFGSSQGTNTVKFSGKTARITSWSTTSIVATVATGATTGNVVVTVSGVASNGKSFIVVAAPSITSLSLTSGAFGASVTITGANFGSPQGASSVKFNGTTATVVIWSAANIAVTVPTGATTGNVVVHASGVDSNGRSFTVLPTPLITNLSATSGIVGDSVAITGTNFGNTQGISTVSFNGIAATASNWSDTSISTSAPTGATTGNIVVKVSGVASNGVNFTVYITPTISSLSPASGAVGTSVTITGINFQAAQGTSTVTFKGTVATPTSWSSTQIKATVPSGAATGNVVVTVGGLASNGKSFAVNPTPAIASASPTSGSVGVLVTITGANFGNSQGSSSVKFNGTSATPSSWSATQIVAPVPSAATTGKLVVHTSGVDVSGGSFRIVTITSLAVSPANLTLPLLSRQRFMAIATNSDGTTENIAASVSWSSAATTIGTIDATGVLTAAGQGSTTVQATFGSLNSSTSLTVNGRSFVPVSNSLIQARSNHTATLLPDGKVLIAGGYGGYPNSGSYATLASAEIYDPSTQSFTETGSLSIPLQEHTATLLLSGKVLIVGGDTPLGNTGYFQDSAGAELYDPATGGFTPTGSLSTARFGHTATLLQNGQVLIAGGYNGGQAFNAMTEPWELYDPTTGTFTMIPTMLGELQPLAETTSAALAR